jgi:hypothetical protein
VPFAAAVLACGAACTSLAGLTSGGGEGDAGQDAGLGPEAGASDAGDAGVSDGADGSVNDARSDAPALGDGAATGFCAQQPAGLAFCTDFDEGPLAADWPNVIVSVSGGTLGLTAGGASPPNALSAVGVPLATVNDTEHIHVDRVFGAAGHVVYSFDVRFDTLDSNDQAVEFASLTFVGPTASSFQLIARASGWQLGEERHFADGGSTFSATTVAGIPTGTWARVTLDIKETGAGRLTVLSRDGAQLATLVTTDGYGTVPVHVYLGLVYVHGPSTGASMSADNVTLRLSAADAG